ncbi:helix-turn-helix domain-containing protein [Nocardia wallacei]|uniref:helix-turn-helix domain-containing protein n=1 Tax=Nocardia wallacei TaxID=480035 RepID=UPI002454218B|nr:helix-turn-helix transcriptional regulator [Nocardia wallacei]
MISDDEASTLALRQLGRFLREAREGRGLSLSRASQLVALSKTALQRLETGGVKKFKIIDIRSLCELYEVGLGDTAHTLELAKQAQVKSWYTAFSGLYSDPTFNMYVGLEASAQHIITYHEIVPGLMQTPDYAKALIGSYYSSGEDVERRVELRMKRQRIVTRKADPVRLEVLLHESAIHRLIGSPRIMAGQLRQVAELSKRPNVSVRMAPFSAGCTWGLVHGPFTIIDFGRDANGRPVEPPVVYCEGGGKADLYLEHDDDVRRYHGIATAIRSTALDEPGTRDLLRRTARSYAA